MLVVNANLRKCRYCDSDALQYVVDGVYSMGVKGCKSVCYCSMCHTSVESFNKDMKKAVDQAQSYWNRGIYDAGKESESHKV